MYTSGEYGDPANTCPIVLVDGLATSDCPSSTISLPLSCDSPNITIEEPPFLRNGPGYACSVSANYSSILQQCCPGPNSPNILNSAGSIFTSSFGNYTSDNALPEFGTCAYSYCTMPDVVAEDSFISCFIATHLGDIGAKAKCFSSYGQPYTGGGAEVNGGRARRGVWGWWMVGLVVGGVVIGLF